MSNRLSTKRSTSRPVHHQASPLQAAANQPPATPGGVAAHGDAELAALYLRLAGDEALWQRLADAGQALVRERYEPGVAVAPLLAWLEHHHCAQQHTEAHVSTIVRA